MILGIDHVGIAVTDAAVAGARLTALTGVPAGTTEDVAPQFVRVCFVPTAGASIELVEPLGVDSPVARFLANHGEGLHHVCFAVDDVRAESERLSRQGFQLIDQVPRPGHGGLVVFLHPKSASGVLIELLQRERPAT